MPSRARKAPKAGAPKAAALATRAGRGGPRVSISMPVNEQLTTLLRSMGLSDPAFNAWTPYLSASVLRDSEKLDDPYMREAWVAACVDMLAKTVASVKLRFYDRDADDENAQEIVDGPLFELFSRVSEFLSPAQLRMQDALNISLTGDSVWFLRDKAGNPVMSLGDGPSALIDLPKDIVPVRGDYVQLVPDQNGAPASWRVRTTTGTRDWPAASVVLMREMPDPGRPFRGIGPLAHAWGPAEQNYMARRYQKFLLGNNGEPGGWVTLDGVPTGGPEWRIAQEEMEREYSNPQNAGKWHLVEGAAKVTPNRTTPKDMEYSQLLKANQSDIAALFGTPGALLGEHQENFATFSGHMIIYLVTRVKPFLNALADIINRQFLARLRDPKLASYQARYDTEDLDQAFRDVGETADKVLKLCATGLPRGQAFRSAGMKVDPFVGDDVPMVAVGLVPLELAILRAQAETAEVLQRVGVPGQESFDKVGLEATFEELPPPVLPPGAPGAPAADGSAGRGSSAGAAQDAMPDDGAAAAGKDIAPGGVPPAGQIRAAAAAGTLEPTTEPVAALPGAISKDKYASAGERVRAWRRLQKLQRATRDAINARIRKVLYAERRAQLYLLKQFAETGSNERASVYAFRGCDVAPAVGQLAVYGARAATLPPAALRALQDAIDADRSEEIALRRASPNLLRMDTERSCCGEVLKRTVRHEPQQDRWLARYAFVQRAGGIGRCRDFLGLQRLLLTEGEIDQLIVAADSKWAEAIAKKIQPLLVAHYQLAAEDLAKELGVSVIDVTNPEIMKRIQERAVKVAEGTQSQLAKRLRSELVQALAERDSGGSLQQRIIDALKDLQAGTTRAFNSHASRALAIARTETAIATNNARFDQMVRDYRDGIIAGIRWLTSGRGPESAGGTVRDSHFVLEGATTIPGAPFLTGLGNLALYPGDPSLPPGDLVNCECTIAQIIAELAAAA